jgi:pilus assembly protein Flp/PilA
MRRRREDGASAVEYGLMIAAVAAVVTAAVFALGGMVQDAFASHSACFSSHIDTATASC